MTTPSPEPELRLLDLEKDLPALTRMWREVGWAEEESDEKQLPHFYGVGRTLLATLYGDAECAVHTAPGTLRLLATDLPLCAVTAVTTSRIARGLSLAQRLTALQLAAGAEAGAAVSALGMFDQGFYNKLGFSNGSYMHELRVDPSQLKVDHRVPTPVRLNHDDYAEMHQALLRRQLRHGSVSLNDALLYKAELGFDDDGFGLGYREAGELTHFIWLSPEGEHGPYEATWVCYRNGAQYLQLLGLLKSLADQVYAVDLYEPPEFQLQALLDRPFRHRRSTRGSELGSEHSSAVWFQQRLLDLPACVAALRVAEPLEFALEMSDPVTTILAREPGPPRWQGAGGRFRLRLGRDGSSAEALDSDAGQELPLLRGDVGTISRLLWGVLPASSLALTEGLEGHAVLLAQLDQALRLPPTVPGWDF